MAISLNPQFHDEFVALVALYFSGEISEEEWALLQIHMAYCDSCHETFLQYQKLTEGVIPAMAAVAASEGGNIPAESAASLDAAEQRLMNQLEFLPSQPEAPSAKRKFSWHLPSALIAACVVALSCLVSFYLIHNKRQSVVENAPPVFAPQASQAPPPVASTTGTDQDLKRAKEEIASLEKQLNATEDRLRQSNLSMTDIEEQLQTARAERKQISEERDALSTELATAQAETVSLRNRLTLLGTNNTPQVERVAALETRVRDLSAALDEKNLQLNEKAQLLDLDKEFLDHDRDIRDVIGARNLYIADISDLTTDGKTAKQFGRIFYTKDRSLLFYGFDLDSQASHKQDVSFQVWGSGSDRSSPVNLGLFYQDDTHKRWVLRCNDAKTLARLDMVFVTVEPPGGSSKPTGKQLLRAYLQIQPNHP